MVRPRFAALLMMIAALLLWYPATTHADDPGEFRRIIAEQISAFNADDGTRAFSYATPSLQQLFATPDNFMAMVKRGYQPVYRQQSYRFAETFADTAGRPAQKVIFVDQAGKVWTAVYTFERQPDGTWRISGCVLLEARGADA
jgi:hypothetical protein